MNMMKMLFYIALFFCAPLLTSSNVMAESVNTTEPMVLKPVMVIRFNQPQVDFKTQLQSVIQRATELKKDVTFDVIQYVPINSSPTQYDDNFRLVLREFTAKGFNSNNLNASMQTSPDVATDEVYIYAR
jgi:hypothetical protein